MHYFAEIGTEVLTISHIWWLAAVGWFLTLLLIDRIFIGDRMYSQSLQKAVARTLVWFTLGMIPGVAIWQYLGSDAGSRYFVGFLIENALSFDNILVWSALLAYLNIPKRHHAVVLFWGIGAAIILRTIFIFAGSAVIENFSPALIVLGVLLIYGAFKMLLSGGNAVMDTERSMIVRVAKRIIPLSTKIHGDKMFVMQKGKYVATVLFLAVVALEITDILFAIDSMPAAIATVRSPFIEVTSDVAALLCIRSLYFVFEALKSNFWLLHKGLFIVLLGIGVSLVLEPVSIWGMPWFGIVVPITYSLGFVGVVITVSLGASILVPQPKSLRSRFY